MSKNNKNERISSEMKLRKGNKSWNFLNVTFENVDSQMVKRHILYLIAISLIIKFLVLLVTPGIFHSFIDYFDLEFYLEHGISLVQGQLPYVNYSFDYPILLFVPITIALVPAPCIPERNGVCIHVPISYGGLRYRHLAMHLLYCPENP